MPTRKPVNGRVSREGTDPRITRQQKKPVECVQVQPNTITEIITSSARKKKGIAATSETIVVPASTTDLNFDLGLVEADGSSSTCDGYWSRCQLSEDHEIQSTNHVEDTIFSPSFHNARNTEGEISNQDLYKVYRHGNQQYQDNDKVNIHIDSPAIYLTLQSSKLECIEDNDMDVSAKACQVEEVVEYDDFDPFLFMKNLPELSSVVPTFRRALLPKQTRSCPSTTLVLDLDETLVHSSLEPCDDADFTFSVNFNLQMHPVYVRCRPHLRDFLERVSTLFEIIIFTASQSIYAHKLLNILDPKRKIFRHRVYRDSCVYVDGNYLKDLSVLGRDLSRVVIVDNSPLVFGFQVDNGIPIESWFDDRSDTELLMLLPFLESLVGVQDVRPLIAEKYNLREKIEAAVGRVDYQEERPF